MYAENIFYHDTLQNIFRILNNSVYFQNIVVCNEPLRLVSFHLFSWYCIFKHLSTERQINITSMRINDLQVARAKELRVSSLPHCQLQVANQEVCELQAHKSMSCE